jgi:hypothetical protein
MILVKIDAMPSSICSARQQAESLTSRCVVVLKSFCTIAKIHCDPNPWEETIRAVSCGGDGHCDGSADRLRRSGYADGFTGHRQGRVGVGTVGST